MAATTAVAGTMAAAPVLTAGAAQAASVVNHQAGETTINITVHAAPGQSEEVIVQRVMEEMRRLDEERKRGALYDHE